MKTSLKTYIKNTLLCIKYPFLYPRNRWDDKYHANILAKQINKAREEAFQWFGVHIKLERGETGVYSNYINLPEFNMNANLIEIILSLSQKSGQQYIHVYNEYDSKIIFLKDTFCVSDDKYEILGLSTSETYLKNPIINIHVKLKDETDTTNYGFTHYGDYLKKDQIKFYKHKFLTWLDEKILDRLFPYPAHTEWDSLKQYPGWYKAFGQELLDEIYHQLKKEGLLYKCRIYDIKEKFGVLEIYTNCMPVYNIISKYRKLSWNTCILCGKPSEVYTTSWISPYCNDCIDKLERKPNVKPITKYNENDIE